MKLVPSSLPWSSYVPTDIKTRKRLAADNGSGWTLAVEYETDVSVVVGRVITETTGYKFGN
jgi:hypothetical protein